MVSIIIGIKRGGKKCLSTPNNNFMRGGGQSTPNKQKLLMHACTSFKWPKNLSNVAASSIQSEALKISYITVEVIFLPHSLRTISPRPRINAARPMTASSFSVTLSESYHLQHVQ